ncbi:MAG: cell division protein FtsA [Bacteroidales bacterium]|jgi:cell division protein FtsA|nr:cell division protein FtsA [Bacteroidales bacterium]
METIGINNAGIDESKTFSAIDIGTTKIVALTGYTNERGEIVVLGCGSVPSKGVRRGNVENIETVVQSIKNAVDKAREEAGFFCKKVMVGVAGQHIRSTHNRHGHNRENHELPISQKEIDALCDENRHVNLDIDEEIIHIIPQAYVIDSKHITNTPVGVPARRIEGYYHIVIGKTELLKYIRTAITRVGLELQDFMLEPLASAKSVTTPEERELGCVVIDIGGGTTDIAIFHENAIKFTEVIPFGGNVITSDIQEACKVLFEEAEQIKIGYARCIKDAASNDTLRFPGLNGGNPREVSFKTLAGVTQCRMEEIIDAALYVINSSGYSKCLNAGIIVTGGGAELKDLPQLLTFKMRHETRIGKPRHAVRYTRPDLFNYPHFATAVGLLMYAAEEHKKQYRNSPLSTEHALNEPVETHNETYIDEKNKAGIKISNFFKKIIGSKNYDEEYAKHDTRIAVTE